MNKIRKALSALWAKLEIITLIIISMLRDGPVSLKELEEAKLDYKIACGRKDNVLRAQNLWDQTALRYVSQYLSHSELKYAFDLTRIDSQAYHLAREKLQHMESRNISF